LIKIDAKIKNGSRSLVAGPLMIGANRGTAGYPCSGERARCDYKSSPVSPQNRPLMGLLRFSPGAVFHSGTILDWPARFAIRLKNKS
jgi:hypothetical protein